MLSGFATASSCGKFPLPMPTPRIIWALLPLSLGYARDIATGIGARLRGSGSALRLVEDREQPQILDKIAAGDGVIIRAGSAAAIAACARACRHVVNVSAQLPWTRIAVPSVLPDNHAVGRLAADHLVARGYRHCAAFYHQQQDYSQQRCDGFAQGLADHQLAATAVALPARADLDEFTATTLQRLPRPLGLFLTDDPLARLVLPAAHQLGIRLPEDLGLVAVDNDRVICETLDPALSSVDPNARRIGFDAADLILRLWNGKPPPAVPVLVPPRGVVARGSTGAVVTDNPLVKRAVDAMRQQLAEPISMTHLAQSLGVSRRSLERAMTAALGCSPAAHWRRLRLEQAACLLVETDWPIKQIAAAVGFAHDQHFATLFKQHYHEPPATYRKARAV